MLVLWLLMHLWILFTCTLHGLQLASAVSLVMFHTGANSQHVVTVLITGLDARQTITGSMLTDKAILCDPAQANFNVTACQSKLRRLLQRACDG